MPSFCVVSNCEFKYTHSENVSFHKFPRHSKKLLEKWIQFTGRDFSWKPSRWSAICSRHFLHSDFRDTTSTRKCLKRFAIPSITEKNFDVDAFLESNEKNIHKLDESVGAETNCRFCGLCCKAVTTFSSNFEVFGMIQKCFPSLNIRQDDNLPKDICSACLQRLQTFSDFVDNVLKTQNDLQKRFATKNLNIPPLSPEKPLKIKQEPTIKIKQEISEGLQDILNGDLDVGMHEEESVDQKSRLSQFSFKNSQEIINNCDIMEIITLDDAFIDIPDDEAGNEEPIPEQDSKLLLTMVYPKEEHNYSKVVQEIDELKVAKYKTEKSEETDILLPKPSKSNKDIIIINESIVKPVPAYDLYQCDYCSMQFLTEGILTEHRKLSHISKVKVCTPCNARFKTFYDFLRHKIAFHKKGVTLFKKKTINHKCPKCKKVCTTKLALINHIKYLCKYQQEKLYKCKYCKEKLKKWIFYKKHERNCKKSIKDAKIKDSSVVQKTLDEWLPDKNGKFACRLCSRTYRSRRNVLQHESSHRPLEQWNYKCGDCSKMFDFCNDLRCHLKNKECKAAPVGADHVYFVCTTCGTQFKSLTKLKWHNLIHTGMKPFSCETCGKSFRSFNNLYQHRITHTNVRRHKCDLCEKSFKRRGGLNQHKRAFHFRLKPHECPICKHRYALKGDMVRCKHSALRERLFNPI